MKVSFVGAGPGDPELLTLKGRRLLEHADIVIYAGSLVNQALLSFARPGIPVFDSAPMTLDDVLKIYEQHAKDEGLIVRLHTGDPAMYGAIQEQLDYCAGLGIATEVVPGVSSVFASAAALQRELTLPGVSQTVILTRMAGRTAVPEAESIASLASHKATMGIFLSATKIKDLVQELVPAYGSTCPVRIVHRASWPDEHIISGTLDDIAEKASHLGGQAMILVGQVLEPPFYEKSKLYDPAFSHGARKGNSSQDNITTQNKGGMDNKANRYLAVITLDDNGSSIFKKIKTSHPDAIELRSGRDGEITELFKKAFLEARALVAVMATGIVVRMIGQLAKSKYTDPAVVVVDDAQRWAISLLSGHEGGANNLAYEISALLGTVPVITTGTDTKRRLIIGVGCRRGTEAMAIEKAVKELLAEKGYTSSDVRQGASIRLKADETGLVEAFKNLNIPLVFIDENDIKNFDGPYNKSPAAEKNLGIKAVAEPCALLAGRRTSLIEKKRVFSGGITLALAVEN